MGASRAPPSSSGSTSASRATSCPGSSSATRPAASSTASGSPSSRRHSSATAGALPSLSPKSGRRSRARSTKSVIASDTVSGGTGKHCSPCSRSGSRLVASTWSRGHAATSSPSSGLASRTCSTLSATRSAAGPPRRRTSASSSRSPGCTATCTARARALGTLAAPATLARYATWTPPGNLSASARAASTATRVLPTPPGPVNVTNRLSPTTAASAASSRSRPTVAVAGGGGPSRASRRSDAS